MKKHKVLLFSTLILGSLTFSQVAQAKVVTSQPVTVETASQTSIAAKPIDKTTDKASVALLSVTVDEETGKHQLNIQLLGQVPAQRVQVKVWSDKEQKDSHLYEAKLVSEGLYQVDLDKAHHLEAAIQFEAEVQITKDTQVQDQLNRYTFAWHKLPESIVPKTEESLEKDLQQALLDANQPATEEVTADEKLTQDKTAKDVATDNSDTTGDVVADKTDKTASDQTVKTEDVEKADSLVPEFNLSPVTPPSSELSSNKTDASTKTSDVSTDKADASSESSDVPRSNETTSSETKATTTPSASQSSSTTSSATLPPASGNSSATSTQPTTGSSQLPSATEPAISRDLEEAPTGGGARAGSGAGNTDVKDAITVIKESVGEFDVYVSNVSLDVKSVMIPIWSDTNGQDDLVWYEAKKQLDGSYRAHIKASNHKFNSGVYNIHLYYTLKNGQMIGKGGTTTAVTAPEVPENGRSGKITARDYNPETGSFEVVVSNVYNASGLSKVVVPVWSETGGQDDIKWYEAKEGEDGTYRVKVNVGDHKFSSGTYHAHLYYVNHQGQMVGVSGTSTQVKLAVTSGDVSITNQKDDRFDVIVKNVSHPTGVSKVVVPVWSDAGGQDDIKWYEATQQTDGTYKVTVKLGDHKNDSGTYHAHLYYRNYKGETVGVTATSATVKTTIAKSGQLMVENVSNSSGTFDIVVNKPSNPGGIQKVLIPVWSDAGGQDDIKWYEASAQADGNYRLSINIKDHKNQTGKYHAHLYYLDKAGQMVGVDGLSTTIGSTSRTGAIQATNVNKAEASFELVVTNISDPAGIKEVVVPVWSEVNGQNDIRWYTASKQSDGSYRVKVNISNHSHETGLYHAHLYYRTQAGSLVGLSGTTVDMSGASRPATTLATEYGGRGLYYVSINGVHEAGDVIFAVWSDNGGQNDLRWYGATDLGNGNFRGYFNSQNHSDTGLYHVHAYRRVNNQHFALSTTSVQVARTDYSPTYFNQRDPRWNNLYIGMGTFGDTGCVPAVLAMIIPGLTQHRPSPVDVGQWLYHNTNEFNKSVQTLGTSGRGIVKAASHYGMKTEVLYNQAAVVDALQKGQAITAAVGQSIFVNYPSTHELLLTGYNNGKTYVMDPWNSGRNGWYDISYLWNARSTDPIDTTEGSPFIRVYD